MTDAQRDSQKAWTYLERLFDWAGTRSKPMPPSDLDVIREQVTGSLDRLVKRADALERAPMLLEVIAEPDGTKTVVIDMRDGSTRKFQTRVDWFDNSPTLPDPASPELMELRESIDDQILLAQEEAARAAVAAEKIADLEKQLAEAEAETVRAREESWALAEEREADVERAAAANRELFQARAGEMQALQEDRNEWKQRYTTASKVIDESLPAIADLLSERTAEVAKLKAELGELR